MKKYLKLIAITLIAFMSIESCDKKNPDQEPDPDPVVLSVDKAQWCFEWDGSGTPVNCILDLGVNTEGTAYLLIDGSIMGMEGWIPYYGGDYTITQKDDKSGKITIVDPYDPSAAKVIFEYTNLTEKSVELSNELPYAMDKVPATLSEEKVEMTMI